jgi:DNA repair photolyase
MKNFKGKAIYKPSGKAAEYSEWACNFYVGCSNGCEYCYCKKGILAGAMGQDKPQLKKCFKDEHHAIEVFEKEMLANLDKLREHGLFFSFTTDPMLNETMELTYQAWGIALHQYQIPVKILTKWTGWVDDYLGFMNNSNSDNEEMEWRKNIAFGFTLTGHDELEPGASTNTERIEAMKKLHNSGFRTWASIEPIIDFPSARNMIKWSLGFCDLYKIGLMSGRKYDVVEAQTFVEWLNELEGPKIYMKQSLQKLTHYTNVELDEYFVESDYNIFKNN